MREYAARKTGWQDGRDGGRAGFVSAGPEDGGGMLARATTAMRLVGVWDVDPG